MILNKFYTLFFLLFKVPALVRCYALFGFSTIGLYLMAFCPSFFLAPFSLLNSDAL